MGIGTRSFLQEIVVAQHVRKGFGIDEYVVYDDKDMQGGGGCSGCLITIFCLCVGFAPWPIMWYYGYWTIEGMTPRPEFFGFDQKPAPPKAQGVAEDRFALGNAAMSRGDTDAAIAHFTAAIAQNPKHAIIYSLRGAAWCKKGDYDKAVRDCYSAATLDAKTIENFYEGANDPYQFMQRAIARSVNGNAVGSAADIAEFRRRANPDLINAAINTTNEDRKAGILK